VRQSLERRRSEKGKSEPIRLHFEKNDKANTVMIPAPSLDIYDSLLKQQEEE
jgi:hypothetical protein